MGATPEKSPCLEGKHAWYAYDPEENEHCQACGVVRPDDDPPVTALAVRQPRGAQLITQETLEAAAAQRKLVSRYIREQMVEDVDYGVIFERKGGQSRKGPEKTLFKAGAEKLISLFEAEPSFELLHAVRDFDQPFFHFEFKATLVSRHTGAKFAEGVGAANTREKRYTREVMACPYCNVAGNVVPSKRKPGTYFCGQRDGGCGADIADKEAVAKMRESAKRGDADDAFGLCNTVMKMAKKRALVDAAIALARCSDLFTQDVEEGDRQPGEDDEPRWERPTSNYLAPPPELLDGPPPGDARPATPPPRENPDSGKRAELHLRSVQAMVEAGDQSRWRNVVAAINADKNSGTLSPDDYQRVKRAIESARGVLFSGEGK